MTCAGRSDLANDKRLTDNAGRVTHEDEIDRAINEWTSQHTAEAVLKQLADAEVPSGPIYSVEDMFNDPHYRARDLFERVEYGGGELEIPSIHPKLSETPGRTDSGGPQLGQHTELVLSDYLGLNEKQISVLKSQSII